jgi:hypothetical protein
MSCGFAIALFTCNYFRETFKINKLYQVQLLSNRIKAKIIGILYLKIINSYKFEVNSIDKGKMIDLISADYNIF